MGAVHGGALWHHFDLTKARSYELGRFVPADVLDAWFPPAPSVVEALSDWMEVACRTSPPGRAEPLVRTVAEQRGVSSGSVVLGAGSSALIFLAFREWFRASSRALLLSPTYGEYGHVLEEVLGCGVDRFLLSAESGFQIDSNAIADRLSSGVYDVAVLVRPNNPTGTCLSREELERILLATPSGTVVWVDEAYLEYLPEAESAEPLVERFKNLVVCKSLSKVYGLSGLRVGYLILDESKAVELRRVSPPWAVSLPAQIAATRAMTEEGYYGRRYRETAVLRGDMVQRLRKLPVQVFEGCANYVLISLNNGVASDVCKATAEQLVFLRDCASMGLPAEWIRVAVRSQAENARSLAVLESVIQAA